MSKNSERKWIPIKKAIDMGLITRGNGEVPKLITAIFWARDALIGKPFFLLPDGGKGIRQEKNGKKRILVHIDALPYVHTAPIKRVLSNQEINEIRGLYEQGRKISDLAKAYDVPYNSIYKIIRGLRRNV